MKSVFTVYMAGLKNAWNCKRLLFFLYGINLLFAYLVSLPFNAMVGKALDRTVMADKLLQAFDFTAVVILFDEYGRGVSFGWNILVFVIIYGLLHTFFSGGIIKLLCSNMNFTFREFLTGCVEYFFQFFKLLLITAGLLLVIGIFYLLFTGLVDALTETTATEFWPFTLLGIKVVLFAVLLTWINMVLDYTKIAIVERKAREVYPLLMQTIGFVLKHFGMTAALYALLIVSGLGLLSIYLGVEHFITPDSGFGITIFFIVAQLYILSRIWLKISFFTSQIRYYQMVL